MLLGLLLLVFPLYTVVDMRGWRGLVMETLLLVVFLQALTVVCHHRIQWIAGVLLLTPAVLGWAVFGSDSLLPLLPEVRDNVVFKTLEGVATAVFLFYLVGLTVAHVFRQTRITWSQVSAATSSYLLLGLAWKGLYEYLHRIDSGSFRGLDDVVERNEFVYFSFVTMTTLGYGDIVPVSQPARMLVVLQAVIGQLFLVILVARLVGMVGDRREAPPASE